MDCGVPLWAGAWVRAFWHGTKKHNYPCVCLYTPSYEADKPLSVVDDFMVRRKAEKWSSANGSESPKQE
jgi:hypothetical protein